MNLNLLTVDQIQDISARSAKINAITQSIEIMEEEVAGLSKGLEDIAEIIKHNDALKAKVRAFYSKNWKSTIVGGLPLTYNSRDEVQDSLINQDHVSKVKEMIFRKNKIIDDLRTDIKYLISGEYRPWTGEILNAMQNKETVCIDSKEKEYAFKVFQQLRKMGVSRKAIASHLHPNDLNPHTLRYSFMVVAAHNNLDGFKAKMRNWNDSHFNQSAELAELLA